MLYKKFHRNYVSQFKKGVRFDILSAKTVMQEPWYDNVNEVVCMSDNEYGQWDLVYYNGRINKYLYVI